MAKYKKMDYDEFVYQLTLDGGEQATRCLDAMKGNEVLYSEGFVQYRVELWSLYSLRLLIAKKTYAEDCIKEEIENWERVVDDLERCDAECLILNWFYVDGMNFMLFWDAGLKTLQGVLFFSSDSTIADREKWNDETIARGLTVGVVKYKNGVKIRDWK